MAPELMSGGLPAGLQDAVLVSDMEAFVVRSMTLDSLRGRLADADIDATLYPVLPEA